MRDSRAVSSTDSKAQLARETYRWDLFRNAFTGIFETIGQTFILYVAIKFFAAPDAFSTDPVPPGTADYGWFGFLMKPLLQASFQVGMVIAPVGVMIAVALRMPIGRVCAWYFIVGALALLVAANAASLPVYFIMALAAFTAAGMAPPLITTIFSLNYAEHDRGKRFSTGTLVNTLVASLFAWGAGQLLEDHLGRYSLLFMLGSFAACMCAFAFCRMPTIPLPEDTSVRPWPKFALALQDKLFGYMLLAWMIMGVGNLMTIPLRVEYLANPDFGMNVSPQEFAIIMGSIPLLFRIISIKIWGWLFDALNFVWVRMLINLCFLASVIVFFNAQTTVGAGIGMAFLGLAFGGGKTAWTLWVTKLARPEQVSDYMGLHSGLTGLRGVAAPFIGYAMLSALGPQTTSWVAAGMIFISLLMFAPLRKLLAERSAALAGG